MVWLTIAFVRLWEAALDAMTRVTEGQTMTEYGLLVSMLVIIVYSGYRTFGGTLTVVVMAVVAKL